MTALHSGRSTRRFKALKLEVRARRAPCCRCGQKIDYSLKWPDLQSFSVDHYPHPLDTHPHLAEDPANLAAAHLSCNSSAGDRGAKPTVGETSERW